MPWCGQGSRTATIPRHDIGAAPDRPRGGRTSSVRSNNETSLVVPPRRNIIVPPRSTGSPPAANTSAATTVIGPPVSMIAENRVVDPGAETATTARRTGCGLRPRPSPKSVYAYCQASAKPVNHRIVRCRRPHHLDFTEIRLGDRSKQLSEGGSIRPHAAVRVHCHPTAGPRREIKCASHAASVPRGCHTDQRRSSTGRTICADPPAGRAVPEQHGVSWSVWDMWSGVGPIAGATTILT